VAGWQGGCARPLNKRNAAQRFEWFSQSNFHFEPARRDDGGVCIFSQPPAAQALQKIHSNKSLTFKNLFINLYFTHFLILNYLYGKYYYIILKNKLNFRF